LGQCAEKQPRVFFCLLRCGVLGGCQWPHTKNGVCRKWREPCGGVCVHAGWRTVGLPCLAPGCWAELMFQPAGGLADRTAEFF